MEIDPNHFVHNLTANPWLHHRLIDSRVIENRWSDPANENTAFCRTQHSSFPGVSPAYNRSSSRNVFSS
jgi:hypothetical protein